MRRTEKRRRKYARCGSGQTDARREASMTKRPSVIGSLSLMGESPPGPDSEAATSKPARPKREGIVHTSIYVPRPVYQKLREIAFTQERKVHDIIMEGIDAALQKYGHPAIATLKKDGASKL